MLTELSSTLQELVTSIKLNTPFVLTIIGILWIIHIINWLLKYRLNIFGIWPRNVLGIPGIFLAPFLHGDFGHLFFNSIPLYLLMNLILFTGYTSFYCITFIIITTAGAAIWLFGRQAIHIGASTVIMGYFGYLLANVFIQPAIVSILLAAVCLYYFSGLFLALFPGEKGVSWESHIFGFLAGISAVYLCPILFGA